MTDGQTVIHEEAEGPGHASDEFMGPVVHGPGRK